MRSYLLLLSSSLLLLRFKCCTLWPSSDCYLIYLYAYFKAYILTSQCGFSSECSMMWHVLLTSTTIGNRNNHYIFPLLTPQKHSVLWVGTACSRYLKKIRCLPRHLKIIQSSHADMKGAIQFGDSHSKAFNICTAVKHGCVPAPTLFGIFFMIIMGCMFSASIETDGIYLHTRTNRIWSLWGAH